MATDPHTSKNYYSSLCNASPNRIVITGLYSSPPPPLKKKLNCVWTKKHISYVSVWFLRPERRAADQLGRPGAVCCWKAAKEIWGRRRKRGGGNERAFYITSTSLATWEQASRCCYVTSDKMSQNSCSPDNQDGVKNRRSRRRRRTE